MHLKALEQPPGILPESNIRNLTHYHLYGIVAGLLRCTLRKASKILLLKGLENESFTSQRCLQTWSRR